MDQTLTYQVFDRVTRAAYLDLISRGYRPTTASKMVYTTMRTIRRTRERDPFFARAEAEAMAAPIDLVEEKLIELAVAGDIQAIKLYMGAMKPEQYRPTPGQMLGIQMNQAGGTLPESPYSGLSVEELRAQALAVLSEASREHAQFTYQLPPVIDTTGVEDERGDRQG